jgi:hypothetical protein
MPDYGQSPTTPEEERIWASADDPPPLDAVAIGIGLIFGAFVLIGLAAYYFVPIASHS